MAKTLNSLNPALLFLKVSAIALVLAGILVGLFYSLRPTDPYIQTVLALSGNLQQGQAIFQANCAVCHGINGLGDIGPSLAKVSHRKSPSQLIEQVVTGKTPPMPKFQPDAQAMTDLLRYLESL